ncbi:MAG: aldehyde dehydrogenase family protein [Casimicrobiaceae bacterium]
MRAELRIRSQGVESAMLSIDRNLLESRSLFIDGDWHTRSGAMLVSIDPATGESNATLSTASVSDIDIAVRDARGALEETGWGDLLPHRRADHFHAIARLLNDRVEPLAQIVMRESGKTLSECRQQVSGAAGISRYYAGLGETLCSEVPPPRGDYLSFTVHEPQGVVAAITPWNSPINLAAESAPRRSPTRLRGTPARKR